MTARNIPNVAAALVLVLPLHAEKLSLEEVATFPSQQVTGVTVSAKGRVFVNFPFLVG